MTLKRYALTPGALYLFDCEACDGSMAARVNTEHNCCIRMLYRFKQPVATIVASRT